MTEAHPVRSRAVRRPFSQTALREAQAMIEVRTGSVIREIQLLSAGASSSNYVMRTDESALVVRFDEFRSADELRMDDHVIGDLRAAGVQTHEPFVIVAEADGVAFSARTFEPGAALADLPELSHTHIAAAGRQLGLFHRASSSVNRGWFYDEPAAKPEATRGAVVPLRAAALGAIRRVDAGVRAQIAEPPTLIHSDFKHDNLLWTGRGLTVLDVEKATQGPRTFDLSLALFHLVTRPELSERDAGAAASHFVTAYENTYGADAAPSWSALVDAVIWSASIFFLVDLEIATFRRDASKASTRHSAYFETYCTPRFERVLELELPLRAR